MRIPYGKGIEIYNKGSPWLQEIFALATRPIPRSVMLGSGFHAFFRELNRTQWFKPERLEKIQESKLRALIRHAYDNVPYYHKIFKERNMTPGDVKTIEDLRKLPMLTKEDVRKNYNQLVALNAKDYKYGIGKTGGSTGRRLAFLLDQQNREMEYASLWRQRVWANVGFNSRIASFRGHISWEKFRRSEPSWRLNALSKQLDFNIFAMDEKMLEVYVDKLRRYKPDLIEGWPSAIHLLAMYLLKHNAKGISPVAVQTSSETLLDNQRTVIEEAFQCRVYDWYGQSEYVVSAGQCPEGNCHIAESGIMELIKNGEQVGEGEFGEIIGTRLYNYSMPFIRYRVRDVGKCTKEECCCERGLAIVRSLEGRVSDIIVTTDGKLITGANFEGVWIYRIRPHTPNVNYVHVIQKSKDKLIVEMVKEQHYSDEETRVILSELKSVLGANMDIEIRDLDSVPLQRKRRFAESGLNISLI